MIAVPLCSHNASSDWFHTVGVRDFVWPMFGRVRKLVVQNTEVDVLFEVVHNGEVNSWTFASHVAERDLRVSVKN